VPAQPVDGHDAAATNLKSGVNATLRNANLRDKPAIIVHGRSDTLVPPAFTSRPYFGQNRSPRARRRASRISR